TGRFPPAHRQLMMLSRAFMLDDEAIGAPAVRDSQALPSFFPQIVLHRNGFARPEKSAIEYRMNQPLRRGRFRCGYIESPCLDAAVPLRKNERIVGGAVSLGMICGNTRRDEQTAEPRFRAVIGSSNGCRVMPHAILVGAPGQQRPT